MKVRILLLGIVVSLLAVGLVLPAWARNAEVVAPGQTLFGKSYNELTGEWANWVQIEPPGTNPSLDPDGRYCDLNQQGKIWFLAGTFGGLLGEDPIPHRFCEIPAGKGVFFPIFSFVSFAPEFTVMFPDPDCDVLVPELDEVRCDVNNDIPIAPFVGLEVMLNGEPVPDLFAYRVQSQASGFTFRSGPVFEEFGIPQGDRFPAVSDGYWILLKPLPPGIHTVSFSADFNTDGTPDLGAHYELHVPKRGNPKD